MQTNVYIKELQQNQSLHECIRADLCISDLKALHNTKLTQINKPNKKYTSTTKYE